MKAFLKNRPLTLLVLGLVVMGQSAAWEYVRVRPDYRFIISPWTLRGYETTQGILIAVSSALALALALMLVYGIIKETRLNSYLIALAVVVYAVGAAILTDARDTQIATVGLAIVAMLIASIVGNLVDGLIPKDLTFRRWLKLGIWLAAWVGSLFVIMGVFGEPRPAWLVLLFFFGVVEGLLLIREPRGLSPWRSVIFSVTAIWVVSITMSSALRITLRAQQLAENGVSADIGDLGVTSGIILAWVGGLLAFVGAVGLWAKRRDDIAAHDRAYRQQQAARESQDQLAEIPG